MTQVVELTDSLKNALEEAQRVLRDEAQALNTLSDELGAPFVDALNVITQAQGRVIVTGMGKSGHIGAKIAATLASTGTPSFFVHPGEASHGDLGMITEEDVVIAISHSGGTKELGDVLAHCARFNVPLIAMTGKPESMLGKAADIILLNGVKKEACPIQMAPMSSTTATLALGDALAAAAMKMNGFSAEDFSVFHPGGKLGSKMARVEELMHKGENMPIVPVHTGMEQALLEMSKKRLGLVMAVDENGDLAGLITDGDLRRHMDANLLSKNMNDIMTTSPLTIQADVLAQKAVAMMQEKSITALVVVDQSKPVGVIHIHDCLQAGVI